MKDKHVSSETRYVSVCAPARLHLGFIDMNGSLDRRFGSLGLSISGLETRLHAEYADEVNVTGASATKATDYAEQVLSHFGIDGGIKITIDEAIPEHAGLGSGTQLSLAIATAITHLYSLPRQSPAQLATILHRGARSGIGIGTFMHGGFIVDGGRGKNTDVPPVISHLAFPEHWRIVLIFDDQKEGINGVPERRAFNTLAPMSDAAVGLISRLTLMQLLPAISENDCLRFGKSITEIQNILGDHFAKAQGGRYTSPLLKPVLESMAADGATGFGQSSWGPTGFAIFPNETLAFQSMKKSRALWQFESSLRFVMTEACNSPARVEVDTTKESEQIKKLKANT